MYKKAALFGLSIKSPEFLSGECPHAKFILILAGCAIKMIPVHLWQFEILKMPIPSPNPVLPCIGVVFEVFSLMYVLLTFFADEKSGSCLVSLKPWIMKEMEAAEPIPQEPTTQYQTPPKV